MTPVRALGRALHRLTVQGEVERTNQQACASLWLSAISLRICQPSARLT